MESFQVDNGATVTIPMMQQDNYPVKMGADSDLSCTVSISTAWFRPTGTQSPVGPQPARSALVQIAQIQMDSDVSMIVFLPDDVTTNMTLLEESLTAEFVQDLSMTLHPAQVTLSLPALRLSYSTDLLPLLGDLGKFPRYKRQK